MCVYVYVPPIEVLEIKRTVVVVVVNDHNGTHPEIVFSDRFEKRPGTCWQNKHYYSFKNRTAQVKMREHLPHS